MTSGGLKYCDKCGWPVITGTGEEVDGKLYCADCAMSMGAAKPWTPLADDQPLQAGQIDWPAEFEPFATPPDHKAEIEIAPADAQPAELRPEPPPPPPAPSPTKKAKSARKTPRRKRPRKRAPLNKAVNIPIEVLPDTRDPSAHRPTSAANVEKLGSPWPEAYTSRQNKTAKSKTKLSTRGGLMICPQCAYKVLRSSPYCPHCGCILDVDTPQINPRTKGQIIFWVVLLVIFLLFARAC